MEPFEWFLEENRMDTTVLDYFQHIAKQWDTLRANYFDESVIAKALAQIGLRL